MPRRINRIATCFTIASLLLLHALQLLKEKSLEIKNPCTAQTARDGWFTLLRKKANMDIIFHFPLVLQPLALIKRKHCHRLRHYQAQLTQFLRWLSQDKSKPGQTIGEEKGGVVS